MSVIKPAVNAVKARRKFLTGATAAGAGMATLGFPMVSNAQTVNFRFQSTWPAKDIFSRVRTRLCKQSEFDVWRTSQNRRAAERLCRGRL